MNKYDNLMESVNFINTEEYKQKKERFINLLKKDDREGMHKLICFLLKNSDFFTAPASTRFHNCFDGGLLDHSLKVRDLLAEKNEEFNLGLTEEEINLSGLLHDLCKVNIYQKEWRRKKVDNTWIDYRVYTCEDSFPMGHGEKSVLMLQNFINLSRNELFLIRWHMGFSDKDNFMYLNNALTLCPAISAIMTADLEASNLLENHPQKDNQK